MSTLKVTTVDFHLSENSRAHKTDKFELVRNGKAVVLRRGQPFNMTIHFREGHFEPTKHQLILVFCIGQNPQPTNLTRGIVHVSENPKHSGVHSTLWTATMTNNVDKSVTVDVTAPLHAPVGLWKLQVKTGLHNSGNELEKLAAPNDIYMLFNPWNRDDQTYMPQENLLDEYVLRQDGKLYMGTDDQYSSKGWEYGQFAATILPCVDYIMNSSKLDPSHWGNPVVVSRMISKMVNSNDDYGVLYGRWDGNYEDGRSPTSWSSSVPILTEYFKTKNPVRYGQCWVFAALCVTICRALGLPSRPIICFNSAHDSNCTMSVDYYIDANHMTLGHDPRNPNGADSIWNFHAWTEVWIQRTDMPKEFSGWHVIDSTPQELSDTVFQLGPASVNAVKTGHINHKFDTEFVLSETNAEVFYWKADDKHPNGYKKYGRDSKKVGSLIVTKKPLVYDMHGDSDVMNVTNEYKYPEGDLERKALRRAASRCGKASEFYEVLEPTRHSNVHAEDVHFLIEPFSTVLIGETFNVTVTVKNEGREVREVLVSLDATSENYTGKRHKQLKHKEETFKMEPLTERHVVVKLSPEDYLDKLAELNQVKVSAICEVLNTGQTWADVGHLQLLTPKLDIQVPDDLRVNKSARITLRFVNPLKTKLTNGKFYLSSDEWSEDKVVKVRNAKPGALVKVDVDIVPRKIGEHKLLASFVSNEIANVQGRIAYQADKSH